jgi:FkbM family methyltransferase
MWNLDRLKLFSLHGLARLLRLPLMRGRVTISEAAYALLRPRTTVVTMPVGKYRVMVDLAQLELRYFFFGAFEPAERRFLRRHLRKNDVVVDVGANVGYMSANMLCAIGSGARLFAFEPNPNAYRFLQTLQDSSNGAMSAYPLAVSARTSTTDNERLKFYVNARHWVWSSTVEEMAGDAADAEHVVVDTISLADFFQRNQVNDVALIKIDVEGAEADVLKGLLPFITEGRRPALLCEIVPSSQERWRDTLEQIRQLLARRYGAFRVRKWGELVPVSFEFIEALTHTENIVFATDEWVSARKA